jgi:hypothetical protein
MKTCQQAKKAETGSCYARYMVILFVCEPEGRQARRQIYHMIDDLYGVLDTCQVESGATQQYSRASIAEHESGVSD